MTAMTSTPTDSPLHFVRRHIGPSPSDMGEMLEAVGGGSLDELIDQTVPSSIRQTKPLDLGTRLPSMKRWRRCARLAAQNRVMTSLIGQGYYGTVCRR